MKLSVALALPLAVLQVQASVGGKNPSPALAAARRHLPANQQHRAAAARRSWDSKETYSEYEAPAQHYEKTWTAAAEEESTTTKKVAKQYYDYDTATWEEEKANTSAWKEHKATTTSEWHEKATAKAHETTKYGSGSYAVWSPEYDDCVQQCQVKYPALKHTTTTKVKETKAATYAHKAATPTAAVAVAASASGTPLVAGPGQVVVAPIKGDLRMVPFNIIAKEQETIEFVWGAGPHTVTQSSAAEICTKSKEEGAFASGQQNATFSFPVKVEATNTKWYFCGVADHCKKGMFGLINGAVVADVKEEKSFKSYIRSLAAKDPDFASTWNETTTLVAGTAAAEWGSSIDTSQLPEWALPASAYSILATRQFYAENPSLLAAQSNSSSFSSLSTGSGTGTSTSTSAGTSSSALATAPSTDGGATAESATANDRESAASLRSVSFLSTAAVVLAVSFAMLA